MSLYQQRQQAQALALMSPEQRAAYQERIGQQGRQSGALRLGAGALDFFGGREIMKKQMLRLLNLGGRLRRKK